MVSSMIHISATMALIANLPIVHQDLLGTTKSEAIDRRCGDRSTSRPTLETLLPSIHVL